MAVVWMGCAVELSARPLVLRAVAALKTAILRATATVTLLRLPVVALLMPAVVALLRFPWNPPRSARNTLSTVPEAYAHRWVYSEGKRSGRKGGYYPPA
jgi:hypothetical protein